MAKKAAPNIDWSKLGFGFSDVNCHIRYTWKNGKWSKPSFVKEPAITMHIGASCLHYGQECFEGIKCFRQKDGKIAISVPTKTRSACTARRSARAWRRCRWRCSSMRARRS